jgi:hypothetical protein
LTRRGHAKNFDLPVDAADAGSSLGQKLKEVMMESRNTPRDDRLAARQALLDELTRLRDQFSAGWLNIDQNEVFAAPQASRFAGLLVRTARSPGRRFPSAALSG